MIRWIVVEEVAVAKAHILVMLKNKVWEYIGCIIRPGFIYSIW